MADRSDDSLLREIDEEIRQEKYELLWKKYGSFVIAGAILLVVGVAAVQGWKTWDQDNREAQTQSLYTIVQSAKTGSDSAVDMADRLSSEGTGGAALLAKLQKAALLANKGELDRAADVYRAIAEDGDTPDAYADLALIKGAGLEIDMASPPADLKSRLNGLTTGSNPWRHVAKELLGLLALKEDDKEAARGIFKTLTEDASTPAGIRSRARQLAESIGG